MWLRKKNNEDIKKLERTSFLTQLEEIQDAIDTFSKNSREGITAKILVKDDNSLDYELLRPYLSNVPKKKIYMSKETYELFEEEQKEIPKYLDQIQAAVDQFIKIKQEIPVIEDDPYKKVSYFKLEALHLLKERPPIDFYITEEENLISHHKPN